MHLHGAAVRPPAKLLAFCTQGRSFSSAAASAAPTAQAPSTVAAGRGLVLLLHGSAEMGEQSRAQVAPKFVKVVVDGAPYLRKVNLQDYAGYDQLLRALQGKFCSHFTIRRFGDDETKLVDAVNGTEYVPTYEDKDGDWILVGDVPWKSSPSVLRHRGASPLSRTRPELTLDQRRRWWRRRLSRRWWAPSSVVCRGVGGRPLQRRWAPSVFFFYF